MSAEFSRQATPRVVIFDAVGTLIYPDPPATLVYAQFGDQFGSKYPPDSIGRRFRNAFNRQEQADKITGLQRHATNELRERQRWKNIVSEVFEDVSSADDVLFDALWEHFSRGEHWRMFEEVAEIWQVLERLNLVISIASNFDERLSAICTAHQPLNSCQRIYWSAEIGYPKPSPEFFAEIARRLNASPQEILFVGDSLVNDYQGAKAVGWNAKLLCRQQESVTGPDEILNLRQILPLVNGE